MKFAQPEWLLLLISIPFLATAAWLAWKKRGRRWKNMIAPRLRDRLTQRRPGWIHFLALGLSLTGLTSLILVLAQPESGEEWVEFESEGRNILFCIDISKSMLATDLQPNRLQVARSSALEILERFPDDRVGVLLFSGSVLMQSPLTIDHSYVEESLSQLNSEDIPLGGSNLTEAVREGTRILAETGQRSNVMVIFSDGEKSSAGLEAAADDAARKGVFIYALGMGGEGGFIPDPRQNDGKFRDRNGNPVFSELDEESLKLLSEKTGGVYSKGVGAGFVQKLDRALEQMDRFTDESKHLRVAKPAHKWFLLGGILLLMSSVVVRTLPWSRFSSAATKTAVLFLMLSQMLNAGLVEDGREALEEGDSERAYYLFKEAAGETNGERAAKLHMAAGAAAFQAENWQEAADSYSEALASDSKKIQQQAHYGLATSLYYLGSPLEKEGRLKHWEGAQKHFGKALELDSEDEKAAANLAQVSRLLEPDKSPTPNEPEEKEEPEENSEEKPEEEEKEDPGSDQSEESSESKGNEEEKKDESEKGNEDQGEDEGDENSDQGEGPGEGEEKPQSPDEGEGPMKEESDQEGDREKDGEEKDPDDEQDPEEPGKEGAPNQEQKDPESSSQPPKNSENGQDLKDDDQKQKMEIPPAIKGETKEETARRLLKQFADFGGKPPKKKRFNYSRPAQDW